MEEYQDPKVKTTRELVELADVEVARAHDAVVQYERSRRPEATEEERFNEGRHGRTVVEAVSAAQSALTQLGMRVRLQLDGRDQARARQLDRILGTAEEDIELVDSMLDIAQRVVKNNADPRYDEGGEED